MSTSTQVDADIAIVGGGGAGLSLVLALDAHTAAAGAAAGGGSPRIVLIDPVRRQAADRTWSFWDDGTSPLDPLLHRRWSRIELIDRHGRPTTFELSPMRYVMLRSQDFYAEAGQAADRLGVVHIAAPAQAVEDGADRATVIAGGQEVRARWIFDSRPASPRAGSTSLLQHFRGWTARLPAGSGVFDPELPTLMDFSTPQPVRGVSFGYCLPLSGDRALVEYTEFSRQRLTAQAYDAALEAYLGSRWQLGREDIEIEAVEDGAIPMTDAVFGRRLGHRIFAIGTAGGATRPSTGYTFSAMQRQAAAIARQVLGGGVPLPPAPYPARHRWMDAVLLRALDRGYVQAPDLFCALFERNPPQRVLRFLDGGTSYRDDLTMMASSPTLPMIRASAEDAGARLGRRAIRAREALRRR